MKKRKNKKVKIISKNKKQKSIKLAAKGLGISPDIFNSWHENFYESWKSN